MPSLSSLAQSLGLNAVNERTKSSVGIEELRENDSERVGSILRFQYFPESISDQKAVNWAPKDIPGGSLPLYQWVSSGERSISFSAVFTTDVDFSTEANGQQLSASIRSLLKGSGEEGRNQDIRTAVMWLRRFMMPRYGSEQQTGTPLTRAPRKLRLIMPGTGIGWAGGAGNGNHTQRDSIVAIMTACEVEWVQYFPSGFPRIATVQLSFAQMAQYQQAVQFPAPDPDFDDKVYKALDSETFQYILKQG
jgi:hypothetical protein